MTSTHTGSELVLTTFGDARLVLNAHGQVELRGGTRSDRQEAIEWLSLFLQDVGVQALQNQPIAAPRDFVLLASV